MHCALAAVVTLALGLGPGARISAAQGPDDTAARALPAAPAQLLAQLAPRAARQGAGTCPELAVSSGNQYLDLSPLAGAAGPGGSFECTTLPPAQYDPRVVDIETRSGLRIGIGKGGQLYSIRVPGIREDLIPDQRDDAFYVDEVFQTTATNIAIRRASPRGRAKTPAERRGPSWHIHQAGTYQRGPLEGKAPLFSPILFNRVDEARGLYETLNLAQQAHITNTEYPPDRFLTYFRLRHLGDDVFEVTQAWINHSRTPNQATGEKTITLDFFNFPWVILRHSAVPHVVARTDGQTIDLSAQTWPTGDMVNNARWIGAFSGTRDDAPGVAITMASDLQNVLRTGRTTVKRAVTNVAASRGQFRYAQQETFVIAAVRSKMPIARGEAIVARYFLVFGNRKEVDARVNALHQKSYVRKVQLDASARNEDLAAICRNASERLMKCAPGLPPEFLLSRKACTDCLPVFELWDPDRKRYSYSTDPYSGANSATHRVTAIRPTMRVMGWLWPANSTVPSGYQRELLQPDNSLGVLADQTDRARYQYLINRRGR